MCCIKIEHKCVAQLQHKSNCIYHCHGSVFHQHTISKPQATSVVKYKNEKMQKLLSLVKKIYPKTPAINGNPDISPEAPFLRMLIHMILYKGEKNNTNVEYHQVTCWKPVLETSILGLQWKKICASIFTVKLVSKFVKIIRTLLSKTGW